jgi:isoaspartyl peptidase/L-asparaginase-like protein (Ntn-hydrolase superfamily)
MLCFCAVAFCSRSGRVTIRAVVGLCCAAITASAAASCNGPKAVLTQQADAHRLASHLHVQFSRAADASNRAVMADTDEASTAAAEGDDILQALEDALAKHHFAATR